MVIGAVLLVVLTILWIHFLWSRRKLYAFALKVPGPLGLPFLGVLHRIYKPSDVLYVLKEYTIRYKTKTYLSWFCVLPVLYTIDPEVAEIVLNSPHCVNKSRLYDVLSDVMGDGLVTTPRWNKHRKLLNPCFYHKVVLGFFSNFNTFANELCEKLDKAVDCGEVDVKDYIFKSTFKAIVDATMGVDLKEDTTIVENFISLVETTTHRSVKPWLANPTLFSLTTLYKPFKKSQKVIRDFLYELIVTKLKAIQEDGSKLNNNKSDSEEASVDIKKASHIYIDQAIQIHHNKEFTFEDIIQEANTILVAGFETTGITLYSTLMCLAMHPQYQDILFEELITIFPDEEFNIAFENLENLVYMDLCINEALRVTGTVPLIIRESTDDVPISKDKIIPKGTHIIVDIFNLHRDEDIWGPKAEAFNPDNFLPENMVGKSRYSFMPYSKGPRNCMGWQYAGMVLKVVLAKVLRKYRFSTKFRFEDLRYVFHGTMEYQEAPYLEIHRR